MPPAPPSTHRFSNSLTVEKNVLGGGSIGHILRNRKINPETYAVADVWYHYDQVGSVLFRSNASGNSIGYRLSDAFGNQLASPTTGSGLWASDATSAGWGHNTKEHGTSTGLVYMYQRWYMPETGTFLSRASIKPRFEHAFSFAAQNPIGIFDPRGTFDVKAVDEAIDACIETQPCRPATANPGGPGGPGPAPGDSCYSFVCCVMMSLYGPEPLPFGPPNPMPFSGGNGNIAPGTIICYSYGGGGMSGSCSPQGSCNAAQGNVSGVDHMGVIDGSGSFAECSMRAQRISGGPPRHPVHGDPGGRY